MSINLRLVKRIVRRITVVTACAATLTLFAAGCAPQDRYDHLITANRSLKEQLTSAQYEREQGREEIRALQSQLSGAKSSYGSLQSRYDELNSSVQGLDSANDDYLRRIARLEMGPLPVEVETAIEDLAMSHPNVLAFDAKRGMLRFASDFTFDLGSVELKDTANEAIAALAMILNDPASRNLEARVVGHTDNVPIGKPETRRRHPTNKHLSVHRAISVGDALINAGVEPTRIQVAGYGEFRPVVPNGKHGAAANRRVEIYLAAMADVEWQQWGEPVSGSAEGTSGSSRSTSVEPMK